MKTNPNPAFQKAISGQPQAQNQCLQETDFIAGAIFRKHESGDDRFYNIIENRITVVKHLLQEKKINRATPIYLNPCTSRYITILC